MASNQNASFRSDIHATVLKLLSPTSEDEEKVFFGRLLQQMGLQGQLAVSRAEGMGRGVFADRSFQEGEAVLREPMFVGAQHTWNKADALVCSHCLRYVGSIEEQIGRRLWGMMGDEEEKRGGGGEAEEEEEEEAEEDENEGVAEKEEGVGSRVVHELERKEATGEENGNGLNFEGSREEGSTCSAHAAGRRATHQVEQFVSRDTVLGLLDGSVLLPCSDRFPLPPIVKCRGGCKSEVYCSSACEASAWTGYHCLLCEGREEEEEEEEKRREGQGNRGGEEEQREGMDGTGGVMSDGEMEREERKERKDQEGHLLRLFPNDLDCGLQAKSKDALRKFKEHADATNDIFHLSAQVVARTLLSADGLLKTRRRQQQEEEGGVEGGHGEDNLEGMQREALLAAWQPVAMGFKRIWWEAVARPEDVKEGEEEEQFRQEMRALAEESLTRLRGAIFDERFEALFSLDVYGAIIGMFELNNLAVVVPSPVENYFLFVDELPEAGKSSVNSITCPLLSALSHDYAECCQGTAFYSLQSCFNHSCCPNAKAFKSDEDIDGSAVLLATRPISKGEQIYISYIDEAEPLKDRQQSLMDYGFVCNCDLCLKELHQT